jgi:hypothetical protein
MLIRSALTGTLAGGAVVAGLVWAGKAFVTRLRGSGAPLMASRETTSEAVDRGWEADALDDVARMDALHDMDQGRAIEVDFDTRADPEELAESARGRTVDAFERGGQSDEPYDALDAEDLGTEWLLRAMQTSGTTGPAQNELFEGAHEFEVSPLSTDDPREPDYGSDQEGAPLSEHAGTHDEDVAAELPVGTIDDQGNIELRTPVNPPDALGAPPTGELTVSEEELARRSRSG